MEKSKLDFINGNPGAVHYGNFINYYQFHPPENRLELLPKNLLKEEPFIGLDIGCNSGELTTSLYNFLITEVKDCKLLAIDIDPVLVERAQEKNLQSNEITYKCLDFMDSEKFELILQYLKHNERTKFSAIFCFSITMWIHLNYNDDGLKLFLKKVCDLGNLIVIEPQPWKCYRSAVKRLKLSNSKFPYFNDLKIRSNIEEEIEKFLIHSCNVSKIYESQRTKWGRRLLIFKQINE